MKVHVYPGMGATSEMYKGPWENCDFTFHSWEPILDCKSIEAYAINLISKHEIKEGDVLIGTSLGGIIACEIANQINISKLCLIGSAIQPQEIKMFLKVIHPIVDYSPLSFIQSLVGKVPNELSRMMSESEGAFIRTMCRAIFQWGGLRSDVPLYRIHGKSDFVISCPQENVTQIDGGHLIAMTHANECVTFINRSLKN